MYAEDELFVLKCSPDDGHAMVLADLFLPDGEGWNPYEDHLPEYLSVNVPEDEYRPIGDCMSTIGYAHPILNKRAFDMIQRYQVCPSVPWIVVRVAWHSGKQAMYWLADNFHSIAHDVLDMERSDYECVPGTKIMLSNRIHRLVVRNDATPPFDFFYSKMNRWFVSRQRKVAWEASGLTGFEFMPVSKWCQPSVDEQ